MGMMEECFCSHGGQFLESEDDATRQSCRSCLLCVIRFVGLLASSQPTTGKGNCTIVTFMSSSVAGLSDTT